MSTCPHCRIALEREQGPRGLLWRCPACDGREMTVAVLRRTFAVEVVNGLWQQARATGTTGRCNCPECGQRMREVPATASPTAVRLDVCPTCTLVWFDAREFEALPPKPPDPPKPAEPDLPPEAREALALARVEAIRQRYDDMPSSPELAWWQWIPALFGFPVEEEGPERRRHPWGTCALAAAIVLVSVAAFAAGEEVFRQYGLIPAELWRQGGVTLLTSFFFHGDAWHLLGNLYFFLLFGDNVEDRLGWQRFLLLLLAATVAGGLAHSALEPHGTIPCIGASGGISGVMVFYALAYPEARIAYLFRIHYHFFWVRLPAWGMLLLWLGTQALIAWQQAHGLTNVSAFAHLGGATAGFLCWLGWRHHDDATPAPPPPRAAERWGQG